MMPYYTHPVEYTRTGQTQHTGPAGPDKQADTQALTALLHSHKTQTRESSPAAPLRILTHTHTTPEQPFPDGA